MPSAQRVRGLDSRPGAPPPAAFDFAREVEANRDVEHRIALEIERQHQLFGLAGAVRVLAFRNREVMGRFDDAIA
jgi:hypothetical protein